MVKSYELMLDFYGMKVVDQAAGTRLLVVLPPPGPTRARATKHGSDDHRPD